MSSNIKVKILKRTSKVSGQHCRRDETSGPDQYFNGIWTQRLRHFQGHKNIKTAYYISLNDHKILNCLQT